MTTGLEHGVRISTSSSLTKTVKKASRKFVKLLKNSWSHANLFRIRASVKLFFFFFLSLFYLRSRPTSAQGLLCTLRLKITTVRAQGTIWSAKDWSQVNCMQNDWPTHCNITLAPIFLSFLFATLILKFLILSIPLSIAKNPTFSPKTWYEHS